MLLYVCKNCGKWQDVSFVQGLVNAWNASFKNLKVDEGQITMCSDCNRPMDNVTPDQKIQLVEPSDGQ